MSTTTKQTEPTLTEEEKAAAIAEAEALAKREVKVTFTVGELNGIFDILGAAPTSSNVWPVLVRVKREAEELLKKEDEEKAQSTEAAK
jgi:hypothetical protein